MRGTALLLVMLLVPASAVAQETGQASSFSELMNWVRLGETVFVIDDEGIEIKGTLEQVAVDEMNLLLRVDGTSMTLTEEQVRRIDLQISDSLGNGALIGLGVGVGFAAALSLACNFSGEWAECFAYTVLPSGLIGTGIGVGVDALHKGRRLVYWSDPATAPLQFRVSPLISATTKGAQLHFSW